MNSAAFRMMAVGVVGLALGCGEAQLTTRETALADDYRRVPEQFRVQQALGQSGQGVLFLNFDGQAIRYGGSSSRQNTSWIVPRGTVARIPAFDASPYGVSRSAAIARVVAHVERDFQGYDVVVTTERPASGDYTMVMVGGDPSLIGEGEGTAGIAPLDDGNPNRNDVVFVFSDTLWDLRELATCISHESGHSFGLEHVTPKDAIMYPVLQPGDLDWVRGQVYGEGYYQDQPRILSLLFGAPSNAPAPSPAPAPAPQGDEAVFVGQEVPQDLAPGEEFLAKITFRNTGDTTWSGGAGYALLAPDATWGGDRLLLPYRVEPGETRTIAFYARAPMTPGEHVFQWSLAREGAAFGAASEALRITVTGGENRIPEGRFEYADDAWGYGWAWDPDLGSEPVWVDIYVDQAFKGSILADRAHDGAQAAGAEGSHHGFAFQMPDLPAGDHLVEAYAVDDEGEYAYRISGSFYVSN